MKIVIALGGNALLGKGGRAAIETQISDIARAAAVIAPLRLAGHQIVITHGNGPQMGMLALQAASTADTPYPLEVLEAENEGIIGYLIEQALMNVLPREILVATLLTQVVVDRRDPAFQHPATPIGPRYGESEARTLAAERGWRVARDGMSWRRVVASPRPLAILEARAIEMLVNNGATVICIGGGGMPVIQRGDGGFAGVEAIIDKDFASALLARQLGANWLVFVTDVDAVYEDFGGANARPIQRASPQLFSTMRFCETSMGPKIEAACCFVTEVGGRAGIGRLDALEAIIAGQAGTLISVAPS